MVHCGKLGRQIVCWTFLVSCQGQVDRNFPVELVEFFILELVRKCVQVADDSLACKSEFVQRLESYVDVAVLEQLVVEILLGEVGVEVD